MDLLTCLICEGRFLVNEGEDGTGRSCPTDHGELKLVIRGLSGRPGQVEAALGAELLTPTSGLDPTGGGQTRGGRR